ncbi:pirin family protein [Cytophagales bacterium LB-30]|uniref:Pirin family protein n=1 Tax=Shiella aurantiaca TaxID=3058365 RepID=A0ABT8F4F7_9BACT|nr:pirin family protein [Shiella aurantiaca]MDN4165129.1 pirin family protein [Shiella aurantiaca]
MSNTGLIIEERSRDIGDFLVGRLLPFREKRMVGPFIFIDHMGPSEIRDGHYLDIDPHPHIGLSTLTYLFEGAVEHRDSVGTVQRIEAGSVNWMTAGKGVTHTERTPQDMRKGNTHRMHGFQIWVALPKHKEHIEPSFHHVGAAELPQWRKNGLHFTLVAGTAFEHQSPVPVHSPLYMLEVKADAAGEFSADGLFGEVGICVIEGSITACEDTVGKGNMLIAKSKEACQIQVAAGSHLLIFGGEPFPEKRHIFWNFVSTEMALIEKAVDDWQNHRFPEVPNETGYIPSPDIPKGFKS